MLESLKWYFVKLAKEQIRDMTHDLIDDAVEKVDEELEEERKEEGKDISLNIDERDLKYRLKKYADEKLDEYL